MKQMSQCLTIIFTPMEMVGHVNSGIGLAHTLRERGHRVIFAIDSSQKQLITPYGFEIAVIAKPFWGSKGLAEFESKRVKEYALTERTQASICKQICNFGSNMFFCFRFLCNYFWKDIQLKQITDRYDPDLFIVDDGFCYPSVIYSRRPWVWLFSANPLWLLNDPDLPPPFQGYPTTERTWKWTLFRTINESIKLYGAIAYKTLFFMRGYPCNPENRSNPDSPFLNIYCYPKELDYPVEKRPQKLFRIDTFMRKDLEEKFELNPDLKKFIDQDKNSKLIFVTLGSFLSADVNYMKHIVNILSKSGHRYIVAKGFYHDLYKLPDNMYGDKYLAQKQIIPLADLVITHGGNNSLIEAFTFGKPLIVIPLYADQFDNAQRIQELNYGIKLDAAELCEENMLGAIDKLLNDEELTSRLSTASTRILKSRCLTLAAELVEDLVPLEEKKKDLS